jgi:ubiquinone/menaquinone biosynthesis C-methylase UbiE
VVNGQDSPFTDPAMVGGPLYDSADRLARRSGVLHRTRVSGQHAGQVIADLAAAALSPIRPHARVADLGCGRGTTTIMLAQRLWPARVTGVDLSAAMLEATRDRISASTGITLVRADFCRLPFATATCDAVVAAFCLYHCTRPGEAIGEIARCLRPGGTAILVTKSADSYRELDQLVAAAGLDPLALSRPGLYDTAHSGNLVTLTLTHLDIERVLHHIHRFTFPSFGEVAEYLATSPKYTIPAHQATDAAALADALRSRVADGPVTTTSVITYVTATRPPGAKS